jgi:hypothetical protein
VEESNADLNDVVLEIKAKWLIYWQTVMHLILVWVW